MTQASATRKGRPAPGALGSLVAIATFAVVIVVLKVGVDWLRDPEGPDKLVIFFYNLIGMKTSAETVATWGLTDELRKIAMAVVALVLGAGGVWALFLSGNAVVDKLAGRWRERIRPLLFVGPAVALLSLYLIFPTVSTILTSLSEDGGAVDNYRFAVTDPAMRTAFRNNVLWLVIGTAGSVSIGLGIAALVDRIKREALAKTFIFLPLAISMVGASVIWRFIYVWRPPGEEQIGLANAALGQFGADPVPFMQTPPINTLALIVIAMWIQTGFAMVILSAALKGVSVEMIEAARVDGATELQIFRHVIIPSIRGSIITVATAIFIAILKVFDIVFVMTGGRFETEVIANRMFTEMFKFGNFGRASALAVILLVVVTPFIIMNIRNLRRQGIES